MANLAASSATHEPDFSHRERRKIVVQHEALLGFAFKALETLHVVAGAERRGNQRLGLAAGEYCAAMCARQNAGFDPDFADLIEGASVWTALVIDYLIAENSFTQRFVIFFQLRLGGHVIFG